MSAGSLLACKTEVQLFSDQLIVVVLKRDVPKVVDQVESRRQVVNSPVLGTD